MLNCIEYCRTGETMKEGTGDFSEVSIAAATDYMLSVG